MTELDLPKTESQMGQVLPQFEITNELLVQAANYVKNSKAYFESQRQDWSKKLEECDRAYRCKLEENRPYKGFDDKASPIIHDSVEMVVARLKEAIIPTDEDLVKLTAPQADPQKVQYRTDELNYQLEKQDIEDKIESFVRPAVKFGTSYLKCVLLNEEKTVLTQEIVTEQVNTPIIDDENKPILDANGQPMFITEQKQSVQVLPHLDRKYFGPGYQVIEDPEDIYLDRFIEDIQKQPIVIQRLIVDWNHLMTGVEKGIYFKDAVDRIKDVSYMGWKNMGSARKEKVIGETQGFAASRDKTGKPKEYEVLEAYCDFAIPADKNGEKYETVYPCKVVVIGDECIGLMPNPYYHQMKPIIKGVYRKVEGEAFGLGAIEPVLPMYHEYNDTMNQMNDSKVLCLNPIKIQKAGSIADQQDLDIAPGITWHEKNQGDIRFANFDFTPVSNAMQYLEILEQKINRGMGISSLQQGREDATDLDRTWRGTNKLIAEADKKFKLIAKNLEDAGIRQWAEMGYKVNCQFNPLVGEGGFEEINGEVGFEVDGVENFFKKQEKILTYSNFAQQTAQIPGMNLVGLVQTIAEMMGIKIDEQKYGPLYSPPPPPMPPEEPLRSSVTISLDPSKGGFMALAAAQILAQRGIQLDLDAIGQAQEIITYGTPPEVKVESGMMPPQKDSYSKKDSRTKK